MTLFLRIGAALVLLSATAASTQATPITVVADYRLGDADPGAVIGNTANATTVDSSGNGHDLTRFGNPQYVTGSPHDPSGIAASFDGSDYFMGDPLAVGTNNFGIEAWVRSTSLAAGNRVIAYDGKTNTQGFGLFQVDNQYALLYGGQIAAAIAPVALDE